VTIRLVASFPNIILRAEDDGKGFDFAEVSQRANSEKRIGLCCMEEKVSLLNGCFRIQTRLKEGTKIYIEAPYSKAK